LVDGSSIGAVNSHTFTNVTEDHTISATFSAAATGPVHNLTKDTYYNTIQEALDDAASDNIIEVADGTYDESITFPSDKVIILQSLNGPSSTIIRGNDGSPTITLDGSLEGTTLGGFTITHANGQKGGRGIWNYESNLSINNCIISNNHFNNPMAATYGGGIGNEGTLTITGSTISGNSAICGGGIENSGSLTITGSNVSGNCADLGGGIVNWNTLTITGSTISDNSAIYSGGIYLGSSGTITIGGDVADDKNTICGNYNIGEDPSLDQQIRDEFGDLYETYKDTNYISAYCGVPSGPVHNLTKDTYYNTIQEALDDADSLGGDTIEVDDGTYNESITFPANKVVTLQSASGIRDNVIIQGANGSPTVTIDGSPENTKIKGFTITHAEEDTGSGIYIGNGNLIVDNCIISDNSATRGGGINNHSGTLTITSSTISSNTADEGGGGGIYSYRGTIDITESNISDNTAHSGGGIHNDGILDITSSTISDNTANYGGGINNQGGTLTITSSTISSNTASHSSGGISNNRGTLTITSSDISGNTATYCGGGIDNNDGTIDITSSTISGNNVSRPEALFTQGGGIHNDGTLTITSSTISGNTASRGGGINNYGTLTITSSTISGNFAANDMGGGIYSTVTLTITGSTISGNTAADDGGGICNRGLLTITSSTISSNTADYSGGISNYGTSTITSSTISGNTATTFGGGIGSVSGTLTITGSTISGNTAADDGGGICNYSGTLTITGSTISGNNVSLQGGGIYLEGTETITIGGESPADKNTICGNRKGANPSLDQQIRNSSGSLYETYKDTNYISVYCE
jgi:hypothetical protein